ncbi:ABC transporter ATP-binding protein [Devosia rhodophyticola]|uniref:ABC transporter ATP-binding protein n=1 Tax=Devosia rhodophyticola TaxID=3026423 RepID=A0ABY7Z0P1_9HYPH|nr:ABC transporter ATP-binding protein [Devosia rhodophyticola]WDR07154.1 ABC transporter ATP-binding protein [Devosia rhodophyticola]
MPRTASLTQTTDQAKLTTAVDSDVLLDITDLKTYFFTENGVSKAVDGVDFQVHKGETLAIVGESGCGKSVTAMSILQILDKAVGRIVGGRILLEGTNLLELSNREIRRIRGKEISMIFQEPMTSLNPVFTIGNQISEAILVHQRIAKSAAWDEAQRLLSLVGIPSPERTMRDYPHQLSGGMRQRAMIAMALSCNPKLLIADEPTTALDVTIQAQVMELIDSVKTQFGMSVLLITHDLGVVAESADRVVVMYAGKVVEQGEVGAIFENALHPYTQGLLQSMPRLDEDQPIGDLPEIAGMVPMANDRPEGCYFHPRCPKAMDICRQQMPELTTHGETRDVRCWLYTPEASNEH